MSILSLRIRIIAIAVVVLLIIVYLVMSATFHNGYDHSVIAIDDDERIPLWYPHQLVKWCPGGGGLHVDLKDWRDFTSGTLPSFVNAPILWKRQNSQAPRVELENIIQVNFSTNVVVGVSEMKEDGNGVRMAKPQRRFFLFACGMKEIRFYSDESIYLSDCAKYGIDGRNLKTFEDCYAAFVSSEEQLGFYDILKYPTVAEVTVSDILPLLFIVPAWVVCLICLLSDTYGYRKECLTHCRDK